LKHLQTRPRGGVYHDASFRRRSRLRFKQAVRALPLPSGGVRATDWQDVALVVMLALGFGASLLLGVAAVLGLGWLVVKLALELLRLVRG
jgi:hypothetical protein